MDEEAERLVVQMAKENPSWGYDRTGLPNYVLFRDDPHFDSLRQRSRFVRLLADLKREWEGYRKECGGRSKPTVSECRLKVGEH
jgi:hypothetical protein